MYSTAQRPLQCAPFLILCLRVPAGSLTVSITDMRAPVVGGSGGVYALCSAHLANVVMVTAVIIIIAFIVWTQNGFQFRWNNRNSLVLFWRNPSHGFAKKFKLEFKKKKEKISRNRILNFTGVFKYSCLLLLTNLNTTIVFSPILINRVIYQWGNHLEAPWGYMFSAFLPLPLLSSDLYAVLDLTNHSS